AYSNRARLGVTTLGARSEMDAPMADAAAVNGAVAFDSLSLADKDERALGGQVAQAARGPNLSQVVARKNLNEAAVFFPQFITDKVVASTGRVSGGEEGALPVLSRRIFVTESLPLPIRGPGSKKFDFTKLAQSGKSSTLAHQSLTVQMVSNPSWYAVMALPY